MKHNLPPLILANGMKLPAELAEVAVDADRTENKRWRVVFGCAEEMGITDRSRIPRLSFHQAGGKALFAGMLFRDAPPGSRAGERIVDYFVNSLCPELGLSVGETSIIRKPVMALVLARCGFLAIESDERATEPGYCQLGLAIEVPRCILFLEIGRILITQSIAVIIAW